MTNIELLEYAKRVEKTFGIDQTQILLILQEIHDMWANEISKQYLGSFFEDKTEKGLFQIVDVVKEEGYAFAHNGKINIKRKLSEIQLKPDLY